MSDSDKRDDEHAAHEDHGATPETHPEPHHDEPASAAPHTDEAEHAPEAVQAVSDGHDHAEPAAHDATGHEDHSAETGAHDEPTIVEAVADGHDPVAHHHEPDHEPAPEAHAEPEHSPEPDPAPVVAASASAATAAPASSSDKRPIWSDHGDAPFDDGPAPTPRYARTPRERKVREKGGKSGGNEFFEILKTIVYALLIALVLRILVFQPFTIPSASMEPNLYEGDYIVVSKWTYGYSKYSSGLPINIPFLEGRVLGSTPKRGDIVVFKLPRDNKTDYIKRVIGLPGDTVQMRANKLYINGVAVKDVEISRGEVENGYDPRLGIQSRETLPNGKSFRTQEWGPGQQLDDTEVFEVPTGHYFMMGDNRDNSIDSRVEMGANGVDFVPAENLVGKAEVMLFSWDEGARWYNPISWFTKFRGDRFMKRLE